MIDMNEVLAKNITAALKKAGIKQSELAEKLVLSKQVVSNMLLGSRTISAIELKKIADICNVSMEQLVSYDENIDTDVIHLFMGQVKTDEAKRSIEIADELIDLYLFHDQVFNNHANAKKQRSSL